MENLLFLNFKMMIYEAIVQKTVIIMIIIIIMKFIYTAYIKTRDYKVFYKDKMKKKQKKYINTHMQTI